MDKKILLGYDIKSTGVGEALGAKLTLKGHELLGHLPPDRYPIIAEKVCSSIIWSGYPGLALYYGVLICQTGIGMCIAANKFPGVRAVNGTSPYIVEKSRRRNNCNILCLSADCLSIEEMVDLVERFINTPYDEESEENLELIREIERRKLK